MAVVKAHVWYNNQGQIIAIGRPMAHRPTTPIASPNNFAMETEIDEALIEKLPQTHKVDHKSKALVKAR